MILCTYFKWRPPLISQETQEEVMDTPTSTQHQLYWWAQGQPTKHPKILVVAHQQKEKQASSTYIHNLLSYTSNNKTKQNPNRGNKQNRKPPNSNNQTTDNSSKTSAAIYWDSTSQKNAINKREIYGRWSDARYSVKVTRIQQNCYSIYIYYIMVPREAHALPWSKKSVNNLS